MTLLLRSDSFASRQLLACLALASAAIQTLAWAQVDSVRLDSLAAFRPTAGNWVVAGGLGGDPRHDRLLTPAAGTGMLVCRPSKDARSHLLTTWEHGDVEVDLEFLLTPGANSGVYLQGRYEIQLLDSWKVAKPTAGDCGGIYQRWDEQRPRGQKGYEGIAPRANACRAPGLWQKLHIEFEAPRFDARGTKVRPARFLKVVLNDFVIHENVAVSGPTRSSAFDNEAPLGPLMIQGDHGPVAVRRLQVRCFGKDQLEITGGKFREYDGDYKAIGDYDAHMPTAQGPAPNPGDGLPDRNGKFARVYTGEIMVPGDGDYAFRATTGGLVRLQIDGKTVITPLDNRSALPGSVVLARGSHPFRLDYIQTTGRRPSLEIAVEGPGLSRQPFVQQVRERRAEARDAELAVEPIDRVLVQRGFIPYEPRKRLYTVSVGSPIGVHYAYDFENGAVLRTWRGHFIDTNQMWEGRGNDQTARPTGPALSLPDKPTLVLLENGPRGDWPAEVEPLWTSRGYRLEPNGQPVFLAMLADLTVSDRVAALADGSGLTRTLEVKGVLPSWSAWVFLAEASIITEQPNGGWVIGDRDWYLDWPADAKVRPVVRRANGRVQLAIPLTRQNLKQPLTYSLVW